MLVKARETYNPIPNATYKRTVAANAQRPPADVVFCQSSKQVYGWKQLSKRDLYGHENAESPCCLDSGVSISYWAGGAGPPLLVTFSHFHFGHHEVAAVSILSCRIFQIALGCFYFRARSLAPMSGLCARDHRTCYRCLRDIKALADSTAVQTNANVFVVTVTNFNSGKDGSTQIFGDDHEEWCCRTFNNWFSPSVRFLPTGTTCTGGNDGASCPMSFTTGGGFGNCVLVSQGGGTVAFAASTSGTTRSENGRNCNTNTNAAGTRLARSLELRKSLGESLERNRSWLWAI
ncbi:hypothetical protein ACEPAH_1544 [Sanghuangporus vaninii]